MWREFTRYRRLDPEARQLFKRAAVLLPRIAISLRAFGFKKTKEALQKKLPLPLPPPLDESVAETVQRTCQMVRAGAHYSLLRPTCLVESLALWHLLERQGIPSSLRIGVRKTFQKFEAHAWVEYAGAALNQSDEQHQHYAAFDRALADLRGEQS
jgi:Transglutaminase-like superfamily